MRAGLLKTPIDILKAVVVVNDYGEETTEWETKYSTRARLLHKSSNRTEVNGEILYDTTKELQVRSYVPIDAFDRIKYNNKMYRVIDMTPDSDLQLINIVINIVDD